jgi:SAM-dependent methyltransferase
MSKLTEKEYWDESYRYGRDFGELDVQGFRNRFQYLICNKIEDIGLLNKSVLEIGAGDSQWLPYFAARYRSSAFAGLDYSEAGCARLAERARRGGVTIEVHHEDMFATESRLHGMFDLVMSFGVVEHFDDLAVPLSAKRRYVADRGRIFTLIPNMAGAIGHLSKVYNRRIYDMHNPHDLESFLDGHSRAGLIVESSGYLCSTGFGVISSCFERRAGLSWQTYVLLTRLSKVVWLIEHHLGSLPATRFFSPYIYAVSRAK